MVILKDGTPKTELTYSQIYEDLLRSLTAKDKGKVEQIVIKETYLTDKKQVFIH